MSFFDEGDEPTRVRPAPRAAAAPGHRRARRRRAEARPDRQTARAAPGGRPRRARRCSPSCIVLGFKGCLDSRKDNALKDYNRNVTAVINDSDQSVGKPFFQRMSNGARNRRRTCRSQINQLRLAAEDDVKRAKAFDVPGDMGAAQRNLELVLNLRAEGLTQDRRPDPGRARPRADLRGRRSTRSPARCRPSWPPTSSTPSASAPLIKDALDKNDVKRPADRRQPLHDRHLVAGAGHRRLAPRPRRGGGTTGTPASRRRACTATGSTGHEHRRRHAAARGAGRGQPRPVRRPTRPSPSSSPTRATTTSPTSRSRSRSSRRRGKAIAVTQDDRPDQGQADVDGEHPARRRRRRPARPTTVTVAIAKVPGEKNDRQQPLELHGHLHALAAPAAACIAIPRRPPILRGRGRPLLDNGDRRAGRGRAWRSSRSSPCSCSCARCAGCAPTSGRSWAAARRRTSSPTPPSSTAASARSTTTSSDVVGRPRRAARRRPRAGSTAPSPSTGSCATTPTTRCPGASRPRSRCWTPRGSGIVISSIHHRDQARLYAKQVVDGRARARALARGGGGDARGAGRRGARRGRAPAAPLVRDAPGLPRARPARSARRRRAGPRPRRDAELVPFASIHDAVIAVDRGARRPRARPDRELAGGRRRPRRSTRWPGTRPTRSILGETVLAIRNCLIAREPIALDAIEAVISHPQPLAQCARFLRDELPRRRACARPPRPPRPCARSREADEPWAALGPRGAAERYGCRVLREEVDDEPGNATRFVWLGAAGSDAASSPTARARGRPRWSSPAPGDAQPGWLVRCLSEFAFRGVNLTQDRVAPAARAPRALPLPRRHGGPRRRAVGGRRGAARCDAHCEEVRLLGTYPAA